MSGFGDSALNAVHGVLRGLLTNGGTSNTSPDSYNWRKLILGSLVGGFVLLGLHSAASGAHVGFTKTVWNSVKFTLGVMAVFGACIVFEPHLARWLDQPKAVP